MTSFRVTQNRGRPGPRPGMPLFAPVWPWLGGHKNWPGLNFKFNYLIFRCIRPFKVQKPTLKNWGVLIQGIQKSYLNFYMKIFFILYIYMKNALVRKNKERACLKRF